ncbi:MAG: RidA family protein [Actinomycetota bacterium]|nr:RidA family protein [Actinomycetota bacterium]
MTDGTDPPAFGGANQPAESPHRLINPEKLLPPQGFSHAVVPAAGRTIYLGGQAGHRPDGSIDEGIVAQFDQAAANVVEALRAAGGSPEHLVSVQIFVTDAAEYRSALREIGEAWRRRLGRHFPAVSLFEIRGLFDARARVELVCVAVVPEG